jgi:PAS domain S-box-containing protein
MGCQIDTMSDRYGRLFETMDQGVVCQDADGRIFDANPAAEQILGLSRSQMMGKTSLDPGWKCISEDGSDLPGQMHPAMVAIRSKKPVRNSVFGVYHPVSADHRWIMASSIPQFSGDGSLIYVITTFTDITERKLVEEEVRRSDARLRSMIDNMQAVFYCSDAEGRLAMISPSGVRLLGYETADEIIGCKIRDKLYLDPAERDSFLQNLKNRGQLDDYQVTLKSKNGIAIPVAASSHMIYSADGSFAGVEGVFRDVSRQCAAEQALKSSEEKFSRAFSQAPIFMTICEIETGRYLEVNDRFCEISGFSRSELIGRTSLEVGWISAEGRERLIAALNDHEVFHNLEIRHKASDGRDVIILHSGTRINYDGVDRILSIGLDITELKRTEGLLRESEERYRQLVEQSAAWIWKVDSNLNLIYSNENIEKILGYTFEEVSSIDIRTLVHPDDHEKLRNTLKGAISRHQGWSGLVLRWKAKDSSWRFIESIGMSVYDEEGSFRGLQGVDIDITDRLELQQEREKRQRLESLGLLAGGIAHDFNNILTGIVGNISLARMMITGEHRATGRLEECEKAAKRASELTQQLLTFARGGEPVKKTVQTCRLINEAVSFALRGSNIKAEVHMDNGLWSIDADEGQINQALNNLLINAYQAMPDGGTITVRAENMVAEVTPKQTGRFVRIMIRDTGVGIAPEILSRIFDPYFTTKSNGTGLGLASVYSIIKRHGGMVNVVSEPGHGTEFELCIPAASESEPVSQRHPVALETTGGGIGRVLVMDDEQMIREVAAMMLTELGCEVDTCCDGSQAVEMYRAAKSKLNHYDAVILDLTIPGGMGGVEAAQKIIEIDPDATLVVSSGYSQESVMADLAEYGFVGAVMKPYSMEDLREELRLVKLKKDGQEKNA